MMLWGYTVSDLSIFVGLLVTVIGILTAVRRDIAAAASAFLKSLNGGTQRAACVDNIIQHLGPRAGEVLSGHLVHYESERAKVWAILDHLASRHGMAIFIARPDGQWDWASKNVHEMLGDDLTGGKWLRGVDQGKTLDHRSAWKVATDNKIRFRIQTSSTRGRMLEIMADPIFSSDGDTVSVYVGTVSDLGVAPRNPRASEDMDICAG